MAQLSPAQFAAKHLQAFASNTLRLITPLTFTTLIEDIKDSFLSGRALTIKQVRGATYPVPFTDSLGLIPADYRILGMLALARNGTDSAAYAAGVRADPVTFQLIAYSAGAVDALVDEKPDTLDTVKGHWVQVSGSEAERVNSFPSFVEEDHPYAAGDVFKYTFGGGQTRLFEVRHTLNLSQNPLPTGLDNDSNYAPFAPLSGGTGVGVAVNLAQDLNTPSLSEAISSQAAVTYLVKKETGKFLMTQAERTQLAGFAGILATLNTSQSRSTLTTADGLRMSQPLLITDRPGPISIETLDNVATVAAQVNFLVPDGTGIWTAGTTRYSIDKSPANLAILCASLDADLAAVPDESIEYCTEVLVRLQPLNSLLSATAFITGLGGGRLVGENRIFRSTYTGDPLGNITINAQFQQAATGWGTGTGLGNLDGWTYGNGLASTVNGNPNQNPFFEVIQTVAPGTYNVVVGVETVDLGSAAFIIECPVGIRLLDIIIDTPGVKNYTITVPNGGQMQVGFFGARGFSMRKVFIYK